MTHVYNILDTLKDELLASPSVNTVTYGDIADVDLDKTTIFPLSHLFMDNVVYKERTVLFNVKLLCADIIDYNNENSDFDLFYGNDNLHDVLNTQFEVINSLVLKLMRGDLFESKYQLTTHPSAQPFKERFSNQLAGWSVDLEIEIPKSVALPNCSKTETETSGEVMSDNYSNNVSPTLIYNNSSVKTIQLDTLFFYQMRAWDSATSFSIDGLIDGLSVTSSGVISGVVTGVARTETMTLNATNEYGTDSVVATFDITVEGIVNDPLDGDAFNSYTGDPSSPNSDNAGSGGEVFTGDQTPLISFEEGKRYFVRIGVPYLMQLSKAYNGGSTPPRITIEADSVMENVSFFPEISRFYGLPTGVPRTESVTITATNSLGIDSHVFDFELIDDIGIDTMLAPYNLVATGITSSSFYLKWNEREYSGTGAGAELYKDGVLYRSGTDSGYIIQSQSLIHDWKIRLIDSLGNFSPFSETITVKVLGGGPKAELIYDENKKNYIQLNTSFSYQLVTTIPATYYTSINLTNGLSVDNATGIISGVISNLTIGSTEVITIYAGNDEGQSEPVDISFIVTDIDASILTEPINLSESNNSSGVFTLSWDLPIYSGDYSSVEIYKNEVLDRSVFESNGLIESSYQFQGLSGTNTFKVRSKDALGNYSGFSSTITVIMV